MVKSYGHLKFWCDVTDRTYIPRKDANPNKTKTNTETNIIFWFSERENVGGCLCQNIKSRMGAL